MPCNFRREHPDPLTDQLSPIALDRQRVIHSAAFRRLQYKTQVFVSLQGDHFRTRLTHTLEVANLARICADALGLDAALAEVVALAHDLGHPPFGHAGEQALRQRLEDQGGFEHNVHSLRVVEYLEHPHPEFRGLNLTHCVRECLAKHTTQYDQPGPHPLQDGHPPPPEGILAAHADRLAYGLHDLLDGAHAGLVEPNALWELPIWRTYAAPLSGQAASHWRGQLRPVVERIQMAVVRDLCEQTASDAGNPDPASLASRLQRRELAPQLSPAMDQQLRELDRFLLERVYRAESVAAMDRKAKRIVTSLYDAYFETPSRLPQRYASRIEQQGLHRVVTDYLAGMTDRFCMQEYERLFDPRVED